MTNEVKPQKPTRLSYLAVALRVFLFPDHGKHLIEKMRERSATSSSRHSHTHASRRARPSLVMNFHNNPGANMFPSVHMAPHGRGPRLSYGYRPEQHARDYPALENRDMASPVQQVPGPHGMPRREEDYLGSGSISDDDGLYMGFESHLRLHQQRKFPCHSSSPPVHGAH